MVARELPSDEVLASWQHVEQRALDLRAAGVPGTLQDLRVRAYLDLLQERDSRTVPAGVVPAASGGAGQDQPAPDQPPPDTGPPGPGNGPGGTDGSGSPGGPDGPGGPGGPGGSDGSDGSGGPGGPGGRNGPGPAPRPGAGPSLAALVTITIPLTTYQGRSDTPGEAAGYGLLDGDDARDLAAAAARHPRTRWCVTALNPDGTAAAHACLPGRHPPPGTGPPGTGPPGTGPPGLGPPGLLATPLTPITRGPCDHAHGQVGYHPARTLVHLVRARNATCTAPGCGRPAARCDLDHTTAWDKGGRTCECNLAPLCRHHHRCKQSQRWKLEQISPGVMVWHTPSGRTYATSPTRYSL